jgi:hypothetical protein
MDQTVMSGRLLVLREYRRGDADQIRCGDERHDDEGAMKVSEHHGYHDGT